VPDPTVTTLEPEQPAPWRPGDFLLTRNLAPWHTKQGYLSAAIRLGEWIRFRKVKSEMPAPWRWNHAVGISDGHLVESVGQGVIRSPLTTYDEEHRVYVATDLNDSQRADCVDYWESMVGAKYGFIAVAMTGFRLVTGINIAAGNPQRIICSGLVAAGLGIYQWRSNPSRVCPTELAIYHHINPENYEQLRATPPADPAANPSSLPPTNPSPSPADPSSRPL
jgi:hypothetical protein